MGGNQATLSTFLLVNYVLSLVSVQTHNMEYRSSLQRFPVSYTAGGRRNEYKNYTNFQATLLHEIFAQSLLEYGMRAVYNAVQCSSHIFDSSLVLRYTKLACIARIIQRSTVVQYAWS